MENWLEINLVNLEKNYQYIKKIAKVPVIPVVKADGYGAGGFEVAACLEKMGVETFATAFYREADNLRKQGIKKEILIFNLVEPEKLKRCFEKKFIPTIFSMDQLKKYTETLTRDEIRKIRFHLKVNTGMNRLGIDREEVYEMAQIIKKYSLDIEGIYSHFAAAEDDEDFTRKQNKNFKEIIQMFEADGIKFRIKHLSNSSATLRYEDYRYDAVRVGMALYGLQPLDHHNNNIKTIFRWKSKISSIRKVKAGERISYGKEVLMEEKVIATVPVGYTHGYMRQLSGKGYVVVKGNMCRIIGEICMDQMSVDITLLEGVEFGDEVILMGEEVTPEVAGVGADTIADDVVCKISSMIPRITSVKKNI